LIIYADLAVADIARAFQEENLAENIAENVALERLTIVFVQIEARARVVAGEPLPLFVKKNNRTVYRTLPSE
jgi:hypothetical protein